MLSGIDEVHVNFSPNHEPIFEPDLIFLIL